MCPVISVPKENLEGLPQILPGRYQFRLDTFKPKRSKDAKPGDGNINLNAWMTIIGHPTENDKKAINNCNTGYPPSMYDMAHACGVMWVGEDNGDPNPKFPGEFVCRIHGGACDSTDPENWQYQGPLAGAVGEFDIVEGDNGKGGKVSKIAKFHCRVPGCVAKHKESLL